MSRYSITVGARIFASKTRALECYKAILNAYPAGEELNAPDRKSVIELAYNEFTSEGVRELEAETGHSVKGVMVDYHPEFPSTKCFFLLDQADMRVPFSYRLAITGALSHDQVFSRACRHLVGPRLREFKMEQFRNRPVRCALTNQIVEWEECHVDHKAPLTFSVIVRSFIVANSIDTGSVDYAHKGGKERFASGELAEQFQSFHKEMAVLRLVAASENARLSSGARIKPTSKDRTLTSNSNDGI